MAHTMQNTSRTYGFDLQPAQMVSYRTGVGHFEPLHVRYNQRERELATKYCETSLKLSLYQVMPATSDFHAHPPTTACPSIYESTSAIGASCWMPVPGYDEYRDDAPARRER